MAQWNDIFQEQDWKSFFSAPNEFVDVFIQKVKKQNNCKNVLDLGCGLGRHTLHMAGEGFSVSSVDVVDYGLAFTKKTLERNGLSAALQKNCMTQLRFPANYFDFVLSFNVLYHAPFEEGMKAIYHIKRILKPGRPFLITLISTDDPTYGNGDEIGNNTFRFTQGYEKGVIHHFYSKEEVEHIADMFHDCSFVHKQMERGPEKENGNYWFIFGRKAPIRMLTYPNSPEVHSNTHVELFKDFENYLTA